MAEDPTAASALLFLAIVVLAVGVWLMRPRAAALAGCTWLLASAWIFVLGLFAAAVSVPALVILWPIAAVLALLAGLLFWHPARLVLALSAVAGMILLALCAIAAVTSSDAFEFSLWLAAGLSASALLFSVLGLRTASEASHSAS